MKKVFRKIHLWLSVPFGLLITLICFSGAMLVFETEVMELCHRDLYYVEKVGPAPLPMGKVAEKVAATLPDSVSVTGVTASSGWLLDSMKPDGGIFWGKMIVGTATLMFVFVLISGIVIWWPRTKKALKNSLKIVSGKGWRRFCYDLHVAGGMYTLVLLLVMALTGLSWSFSWYRTGFYKVFGVETTQGGGGHGASAQTAAQGGERAQGRSGGRPGGEHRERNSFSPFTSWQKVYEELKELNPDYKQITVFKGSATVSFNRLGNQRAADRYTFNPRSGEITGATLYKDADASGKIRGWIFSVHVGSWGGLTTRILSFLAALVGASLPLTGYYLWIRRLIRKGSRKANIQLKKVA